VIGVVCAVTTVASLRAVRRDRTARAGLLREKHSAPPKETA
jgi:hypothetical protein